MLAVDAFSEYFCLQKKFLIYNLVARNLKVRYRKSILGMLWTVLIPAGTAAIYYVIFYYVLKVQRPNYLLFIISGIVPWTFFSTTLIGGLESIVGNYQLMNKVPLPPQALPFSEVVTNFLNLILSIPVVLVIFLLSDVPFSSAFVQYPILIGLLLFQTYSIALLLGIIFVYFRDLRFIMNLVIQFWFYLTPIMYSVDMIPDKFRFALYLNPIGSIFAGFHRSLAESGWLAGADWISAIIWTLALHLASQVVLRKLRYNLVEVL